ncbi:MAG: LPS export ABC transporter periplasmic protein LptC [Gammaproteobacteria bacterium]|nr:MAG: LPS export ABC transporter periplasmic protein LptC [Gammaproteobacteria bacterium]RKZ95900.1 MAG: LPS export ABC transporter periplasmic protein LptC [Gammaproteobacteria bacterium]
MLIGSHRLKVARAQLVKFVNLLWKDREPCKIKLNAISNIPQLAKILLLILAIITIWLMSSDDTEKNTGQLEISRTSDFSMTDFTMTLMDDLGKPTRIISGKEIAHYPEDDTTEITSPIAKFTDKETEVWVISSNKGTTQGEGEDLFLTGNVIINREDRDDIELLTEALHINTKQNTAYTDLAVTIKSPYGETNSVGLHADLADETINLHSRVKGQYDAPTQ